MIKALVFDFDGLILDTETLTYKATEEIFKKYGAELPISIWANHAGTYYGDFDIVDYLSEQIGKKVDRDEFYKKRNELATKYIKKEHILPGVQAMLDAGKELGMKIGLATSSGDKWAENHLKRLGIDRYFDTFVEANDVQKVKPDPEIYIKACQRLGVKPVEAIAFEDSLHGAIAAKAAGMHCVVIPNKVTKNLEFGDVDQLLDSLDDTTLKDLMKLFS